MLRSASSALTKAKDGFNYYFNPKSGGKMGQRKQRNGTTRLLPTSFYFLALTRFSSILELTSARDCLSVQLSPFQLHLGRHELELSKDKELPAHGCRARSLQSSSTFARPCQVYNALEDQGKKYFKIILRAQGILEEKTTEFDWTGLSPGPEVHFLDTVLKWRNGWLLIIYNFSVHLSAKFLSESCLKAFMEAGFRSITKFITLIDP